MIMYKITAAKQWQPSVLFLCALVFFTSCVTTKNTGSSSTESYPCDELDRSERSYQAMKRQPSIDDELMQEMQQRISELQQACSKYQDRVERYAKEYGLSTAEAEKQAAMNEAAGVPAWGYVLIITAITGIIALFFYIGKVSNDKSSGWKIINL